jgi:carbohydrate-binding DOMON domain-containing protein
MNKKIIAGAVIALAAGVAAFIYNKKKNTIKNAAEEAYDDMNDGIYSLEKQTENIFS